MESQTELLKRAAYLGEDIVCVRPDQPDGARFVRPKDGAYTASFPFSKSMCGESLLLQPPSGFGATREAKDAPSSQ